MPILHGGLKFPVLNRFDRLFVKPHPQAPDDVNFVRLAIRTNDQTQRTNALIFCLTRFVREFGFRLKDRNWRAYTVADTEDYTPNASAFTWTKSRSLARPITAPAARTDSTTSTRAVRWQKRMRHRITQVGHVVGC